MDESSPGEPSELERKYYYHGLLRRFRLVARTSTDIWDPTVMFETQKLLLPPESTHQVLRRWHCPVDSLIVRLQRGMCRLGLRCTSFALWRIGYSHDFAPSRGAPPVLLITVAPGSTPWIDGILAALTCKNIMEECGIDDVHCEIREPVQDL